MHQQIVYYNPLDEEDENINIDIKKIFFAIWSRKLLMAKVFLVVFIFFISLTYILPKKWVVTADLYINKTNNSNYSEVNPYVIDENGGGVLAVGTDKSMNNEIELMQSALVIDDVIKENDLRFNKLFGIFPTKKTGEYLTPEIFLKKGIKFENKKNTNVISIEYKSKKPELAYNVVASIIANYIELHKEINSEKSKSDKKIIEDEYNKAKKELSKKISLSNGLPATAISGTGNLIAMSAFSKSAQQAISNMQDQYIAGEKTRVELSEDAAKVAELSSKLEWAKLVEDMSDSTKVMVIKEPVPLKEWQYVSPKLFMNIILGIVFGIIFSLLSVLVTELTDKKLSFLMLGNNNIYNIEKHFSDLALSIITNNRRPISLVLFDNLSQDLINKLQEFHNINLVKAEISENFVNAVEISENIIFFIKIGSVDRNFYKKIKMILKEKNKKVIKEVLL